jgi:hypothetical protein
MKIAVYKNEELLGYLVINGNTIPNIADMCSLLGEQEKAKGWTRYKAV